MPECSSTHSSSLPGNKRAPPRPWRSSHDRLSFQRTRPPPPRGAPCPNGRSRLLSRTAVDACRCLRTGRARRPSSPPPAVVPSSERTALVRRSPREAGARPAGAAARPGRRGLLLGRPLACPTGRTSRLAGWPPRLAGRTPRLPVWLRASGGEVPASRGERSARRGRRLAPEGERLAFRAERSTSLWCFVHSRGGARRREDALRRSCRRRENLHRRADRPRPRGAFPSESGSARELFENRWTSPRGRPPRGRYSSVGAPRLRGPDGVRPLLPRGDRR
jgi:hypothetical protein